MLPAKSSANTKPNLEFLSNSPVATKSPYVTTYADEACQCACESLFPVQSGWPAVLSAGF
jgi:hypothetical protein